MNNLTKLLNTLPKQFLTNPDSKTKTDPDLSKFDEYTKQYVLKYVDKFFPPSPEPTFDESVPTDVSSLMKSYEFSLLTEDDLPGLFDSTTEYFQKCLFETLVNSVDMVSGEFYEPFDGELFSTLFGMVEDKYGTDSYFSYEVLNDPTKWQTL
jgi:hypothetical protein